MEEPIKKEERRKYPRLNMAVDIQYRRGSQYTGFSEGSASNISAGGICLILYEEAKEGTVLDLNINLPDGQPTIQAKGKVVWARPFNVAEDQKARFDAGVQFIDLNAEDKRRIDSYIFGFK